MLPLHYKELPLLARSIIMAGSNELISGVTTPLALLAAQCL